MDHDDAIDGGFSEWLKGQIFEKEKQHLTARFPIPFWNLCERVEDGLSRTNNSIESWHCVWNSMLSPHPRLSRIFKRIKKEEIRWQTIIEDFSNNPANGIRGLGANRLKKEIKKDENIETIFNDYSLNIIEYLERMGKLIGKH